MLDECSSKKLTFSVESGRAPFADEQLPDGRGKKDSGAAGCVGREAASHNRVMTFINEEMFLSSGNLLRVNVLIYRTHLKIKQSCFPSCCKELINMLMAYIIS